MKHSLRTGNGLRSDLNPYIKSVEKAEVSSCQAKEDVQLSVKMAKILAEMCDHLKILLFVKKGFYGKY